MAAVVERPAREQASSRAVAPLEVPVPDAAPNEVVLAVGGDVNLARECGQAILADPTYDPFGDLGSAWRSAHLRFVNLESQLSDQNGVTQSPRNRLIFTGPPGGAEVLARARISLVSTANNHAWDYGRSALLETIDNLERTAVPFVGTGRDREQAYRPVVLRHNGLSVAVFAVTDIWNYGELSTHAGREHVAAAKLAELRDRIAQARREHDFVLLSYHGGQEYLGAPVARTRRFVNAVMALGVDAVIGHHPHVPQGIGWVEGRPVLYSLGNFVFAGHDHRPWTRTSFFARLLLRKGEKPVIAACPIQIEGHRPRLLEPTSEIALRLRGHLVEISSYAGGSRFAAPDTLGCWPVEPPLAAATR